MRAWLSLALCAACYKPVLKVGSPCSDSQPCPDELVCSPATQTCEETSMPVDTYVPITGAGTVDSPYVATAGAPASCAEFLAMYPTQVGVDGIYRIQAVDAYCDMTTDSGGWTLVARIAATSTTHDTASAIGAVTAPDQMATGKLADATTNAIAFAHARIRIETVGTFYVSVTALDLTPTEFMAPNTAAPMLAGPYTFTFLTQVSCTSDCGVAVIRPSMGFGNNCGYRYYASANNPRPGMGCQGGATKSGTLWIK